jgi:hypothetical protein
MAQFKTLKAKSKEYVFQCYGNEKTKTPAKIIFARFPWSGESFLAKQKQSIFTDIDFDKIQQKDEGEVNKLGKIMIEQALSTMNGERIDCEAFMRECADRFENLEFDGREIKSVEDFLSLPPDAVEKITKDCWKYASQTDEFTAGE